MRISDWSSDVCSSDLDVAALLVEGFAAQRGAHLVGFAPAVDRHPAVALLGGRIAEPGLVTGRQEVGVQPVRAGQLVLLGLGFLHAQQVGVLGGEPVEETLACRGTHRSEEHTSELQSLMRISYAVFCLKKNNNCGE